MASKDWRKGPHGLETLVTKFVAEANTPETESGGSTPIYTPDTPTWNEFVRNDPDFAHINEFNDDYTLVALRGFEPLVVVRNDGEEETIPNSFLMDVTPVEKAYISSGNSSPASLGELKLAKNPHRFRQRTDQDIDFDQKTRTIHVSTIRRCVSTSPEFLTKNAGTRYEKVKREQEASTLMNVDPAIKEIGGVESSSPHRRGPVDEEGRDRFEGLIGRLNRLAQKGPAPTCDFRKALGTGNNDGRPVTPPGFHPRNQSTDSAWMKMRDPAIIEISPTKDSGYDTESPSKKLNPAAVKFKSAARSDAPPMFQQQQFHTSPGRQNHQRPHISTIFPDVQQQQPRLLTPIPIPAGLKLHGMPWESERNMGIDPFESQFPQIRGGMNQMGPRPPPGLVNLGPMPGLNLPPLPGPLANPFSSLPSISSLPPLIHSLPQLHNAAPPITNFGMAPPPPPPTNFIAGTGASAPFNNRSFQNPLANLLPPPGFKAQRLPVTLPPPLPTAQPVFPVTKKPRDNDPWKQQQYEAYLEWRKMNEPGFHLAAKQRQANRIQRQRAQSSSTGDESA